MDSMFEEELLDGPFPPVPIPNKPSDYEKGGKKEGTN